MRARKTRARARGEWRSREKQGRSPSKAPISPPFFAINLHNFIFLLAVCGFEQRRTTALGLVLLFSLDIMKTFSRDYSVTGVQSQDPKAHENRKFSVGNPIHRTDKM